MILIVVPEEERENGTEALFEQITSENSPKWREDIKTWFYKSTICIYPNENKGSHTYALYSKTGQQREDIRSSQRKKIHSLQRGNHRTVMAKLLGIQKD